MKRNNDYSGNDLNENQNDGDKQLVFKLQKELLELKNTLEIKEEIIQYLRVHLNKFESLPNMGLTPIFTNNINAHERLSEYAALKKKQSFDGPILPKLYLRKQLLRKYPLLNSADIEMCILLSIGLTNKEITLLTGKSNSTVENTMSVLRNKLHVSSIDTELKSFLFDIELKSINDTTNELSVYTIMKQEGYLLSTTECRVCGYMLLKMRNCDICNSMCISVRTLESHKYRIKKKLHLAKDTSLSGRLHEMLGKYL